VSVFQRKKLRKHTETYKLKSNINVFWERKESTYSYKLHLHTPNYFESEEIELIDNGPMQLVSILSKKTCDSHKEN